MTLCQTSFEWHSPTRGGPLCGCHILGYSLRVAQRTKCSTLDVMAKVTCFAKSGARWELEQVSAERSAYGHVSQLPRSFQEVGVVRLPVHRDVRPQ